MMTTVRVSGLLWDRVVDSLATDHPGHGLSRFSDSRWTWRKVGFGSQASIDVPEPTARAILGYFDAIGRLDGSGMDPDGAADTRREARAARSAAAALRRELDR